MFKHLTATVLALSLTATLAACSPGSRQSPRAGASPAAGADQPESVAPIAVVLRKVTGREYMLYGRTSQAAELKVQIEDGHNMLFGPAMVPVVGGQFRIDFLMEETNAPRAFAHIAGSAGEELAVVPFELGRALITHGPVADPNEIPPLPGAQQQQADRRTAVTETGIESPHFRLKWPAVQEGAGNLHLEGETDLAAFWVEIRAGDQVLGQFALGGEHAADGQWHRFEANVPVPGEGGFRAEYAVVLLGPDRADVELYLQPIRN